MACRPHRRTTPSYHLASLRWRSSLHTGGSNALHCPTVRRNDVDGTWSLHWLRCSSCLDLELDATTTGQACRGSCLHQRNFKHKQHLRQLYVSAAEEWQATKPDNSAQRRLRDSGTSNHNGCSDEDHTGPFEQKAGQGRAC